ncbi:MauE/DoxX family redox-associated membrane protein [Sphingobacterium sp. HMA12]|uniref:MauE/DoxX family redox-associated membrane protein n=1 Tax=Sphingobacterium sp. HMA12 TaxID=2050894 RepID=UPI001315A6BA|nr:MauE/DoxX family redox-associated membrane protein [Sphingobacterium sp. HMA12]
MYKILRGIMILFWIYVGMDKIWQLSAFRIALEQQPVISDLAPILFWSLPLMEIGVGILLAMPLARLRAWGWRASTLLIIVFTIYIGLGVFNVYAQKPCMCTSFLSRISWTAHLLINIVILGLSIAGLLLPPKVAKYSERVMTGKKSIALFLIAFIAIGAISYRDIRGTKSKDMWHMPDSIDHAPVYDTVSRPIVGSLAYRYDRYTEPYRQQLFTKSLQANNFTNQLLACNTERRVALC